MDLHQKHGKIVSGMDAVEDAVKKHKIFLVIVSNDISKKSRENIEYVCTNNCVKLIELKETMASLGNAIGKKNRAIIGIKDKSFSDGIAEKISGGDLLWEK